VGDAEPLFEMLGERQEAVQLATATPIRS
jgi:hypothetical protein